MRAVFYLRFYGIRLDGKFCFGSNEVDLGQEQIGIKDVSDVRTHFVTEHGQDADDLTALLGFQLADAIVGLYYLGRFNKDGLACGTLVVNDAVDTLLQVGGYGYHQSTVAHGGGCILVNESVALGRV